jgi:hypothetical protein
MQVLGASNSAGIWRIAIVERALGHRISRATLIYLILPSGLEG